MIKVAILGHGTVGSGVAEILTKHPERVAHAAGQELELKYILDRRDLSGDPNEEKVVREIDTILEDPEVKVICETMGGVEPAFSFSMKALQRGISVCSSNKELVEEKGAQLVACAREHHCSYLFEASVGGGIPILRVLHDSLAHEEIESVNGILNGTTNYILTEMKREGADFAAVLSQAQEKGYAERSSEADIEGMDACRKTAILASLISGKRVRASEIPTTGITAITGVDLQYADALHMELKLLGSIRHQKGEIEAIVAPFFIPQEHILAAVHGVYNAVLVHSNHLLDTFYYGQGAGKEATASAVVADMIFASQHASSHIPVNLTEEEARMCSKEETYRRFFVRADASSAAAAAQLFGQDLTEVKVEEIRDEFAFLTGNMSESSFLDQYRALPGGRGYFRILS